MAGRVAWSLLLLVVSSHSTRMETAETTPVVHMREGGALVLDPRIWGSPWSIAWYCDDYLVIERTGGRVSKGYGPFRDVAATIGGDGATLTIKGWKELYSGIYTAKIQAGQRSTWEKKFTVVSIVTVEVHVGQSLYLDPKFNSRSSRITWKYGPSLVAECNDGVSVSYGDALGRTSRMMIASGKLIVSDWKAYNDGTFTVERDGTEFKQFEVTTLSTIRVEAGGDLTLDPRFWVEGDLKKFNWMCGDSVVAGSKTASSTFTCLGDSECIFDKKTGELTIKNWRKHEEVPFFLVTASSVYEVTVEGGIVYGIFGGQVVVDPPKSEEPMTQVKWFYKGRYMAWLDRNREYPVWLGDKWGYNWDNTFLNATTGQLTLIKWDPSRVGLLSVEINGRMMPDKFVLTPLGTVENVDVKAQMVENCPDAASCTLVCDGDAEQAEPVKYFWKKKESKNGNELWVKGSKFMKTHANGGGQYSINACKVTNGPSERRSVFFGPVVDVEVEVGTSLYLDPQFIGTIRTITWKNGDDVAVTCKDGVNDGANVVYHGTFRRTTRMTTNGKLIVSDWKPFQHNVFTVEINGGEHVKKFRVANIVRVPVGRVLNFRPKLETTLFRRYNWFLDGKQILSVDYDYDFVPTPTGLEKKTKVIVDQFDVCRFEEKNCFWDDVTGKLTSTKPWDKNGELTLAIDNEKQKDKIKLVTGVVYASNNNKMTVKVNKLDAYKGGRILIGDCLDWATTGGCTLVCDEDVDGAEPVVYSWRDAQTGIWVEGTKHMETKYVVNRFNFDACKMKNPVSEQTISER